MSAARLREAANLMRERAQAATPGRWGVFGMTVLASTDGTSNVDTAVEVAQALTVDDAGRPRTWDADHIRSWHPAVALAVADWLDAEVEGIEFALSIGMTEQQIADSNMGSSALAVADAYLGTDG